LLWSGRALPLAGTALEIGREPAASGIVLGEGLAGVSRLHCTLRDEDGAIVLVDHSRHGTFVNGERVAGRARLRAGDRLRIGDPGVELALIAVGAGHGAPQG
jgi:pSer/pThr/pTyr-binding forkhead associated (FHA) protein